MGAALPSPATLNEAHSRLVALGWKLLQPFRFADTDEGHIQILLAAANFPQNARVLDVGCGIGECARLMKVARPDLEFVLLNFSAAQLKDCPAGFEQCLASAHDIPYPEATFDAVMFNAALGNMDFMPALAESSRVLRPGGVLFLNELSRASGDNSAMERILSFRAYDTRRLGDFAESMGLSRTPVEPPSVSREYLREQMDDATYLEAFDGADPMLARFVKSEITPLAAQYGALFARHESIALQVSGGKDSLAVLDAMRPWWPRLCVFWLNPGDPFPETVELMARIRAEVPHFVEVAGRQPEIVAQDGWPSDVVPQSHTTDGNFVFGPTPFKVQSRLSCCYRAMMLPMHECMVAAGVTCVIRGKRSEEKDKTPSRSGETHNGFELVYPLWDWSESDVLDYLRDNSVELPESYAHASHSLDCMSCTAWWSEGLSYYLKAKHPERYAKYVRRITLIKSAIADEMNNCEV